MQTTRSSSGQRGEGSQPAPAVPPAAAPTAAAPAAGGRPPWRAFRLVAAVGVVGVMLSVALVAWLVREAQRLDTARFYELGNALGVDLERRVEAVEALLRALQRVLNEQESPTLEVWDEFMNQAAPQWNFPGILALGYATNTAAGQVMDRLAPWVRDPSPRPAASFYDLPAELNEARTWRVWVWDVFGEAGVPPGDFGAIASVTNTATGRVQQRRYREPATPLEVVPPPFTKIQQAGREILAAVEPPDAKLLDAVYRDEVKIAGHQPLQPPDGGEPGRGATMLVPTYHPGRGGCWRALPPPEENLFNQFWLRWNLNTGYLYANLDPGAMLREAQGPGEPSIRVEIHAASPEAVGPGTWLNPDDQPLRAADPRFRPAFLHTHLWRMYGDRWTLFFHTTPLFDLQSTRYRAHWAGGWGLLTTGLMCWVLTLQVRGRLQETERATALQDARDALLAVQRERERLSHDLHDGAIQSLYAVQLGLTQTARDVESVAPEAGRRLGESRANLDAVIGELRQFMTDLRAGDAPRPALGLAMVLESVVRRLRPASPAALELHCDPVASARLTPAQALQLAAFVREALSNSLRHAAAERIQVRLAAEGDVLLLEVRDDGGGFDPARRTGAGVGLVSLERRAFQLGGRFELETVAGLGTSVRVRLPLRPPGQPPAGPADAPTEPPCSSTP
ncbi:MAG: sensor histidine kinase [Verrucomicrobiales bacterium]|nr:sensor histidine kinase [Verrucomicrobiales bacterium]